MLFNSYIFLFLFLPLCLLGYYGLKNRQATLAKVWLTCFSLWFYGYFSVNYLLIMIFSILINYGFHRWIAYRQKECPASGNREDKGKTAQILALGISLNLFVLFYFKYYDFFLENINQLFGLSLPLKHILLPLGISFFTFQQISFLADTYRGELEGCSFIDYALFVSFFPQLIAGPIVTHEEMLPQFAAIGKKKTEEEKIIRGIYLFVLGLAKKLLIADTFGVAVDYAYGNVGNLNGFESLLTILFYSLQLYYDFSGYCDMARGIGGMFGIDICENFHSPYKAGNIVEFWKQWHITLSRFFTKNIYIPLGGNRRGTAKMYGNLILIFFLSGLWHGAGWNFIIWGIMHGILYLLTRWWEKRRNDAMTVSIPDSRRSETGRKKGKKALGVIATFTFVSLAWVYFRAADVGEANLLISQIFTKPWALPAEAMKQAFNLGEFWYLLKISGISNLPNSDCYLLFAFTGILLSITFLGKNSAQIVSKSSLGIISAAISAVLFVWCVISLSGVSTFLYFNF
ncbi:MAG: MBOAT family O-acyltransferase [Lachnospiraceae bacterium]